MADTQPRILRIETTLRCSALPGAVRVKREGSCVYLKLDAGDDATAAAINDELQQRLSEGRMSLQVEVTEGGNGLG
jgi:hypothetical protein